MQMFVSSRKRASCVPDGVASITAPCASAAYPFSVPPASSPPAAPSASQTPASTCPCVPTARSHRPAANSHFLALHTERLRQPHRLAVPRLEHLRRRHRKPSSQSIYVTYTRFRGAARLALPFLL